MDVVLKIGFYSPNISKAAAAKTNGIINLAIHINRLVISGSLRIYTHRVKLEWVE